MHITQAGMLTRTVIVVGLTYLVLALLGVVGEIQTTQTVRDQLILEVQAMEEANAKMENALEYKDDPEMLERVAREKGYIMVGETIFMDIAG